MVPAAPPVVWVTPCKGIAAKPCRHPRLCWRSAAAILRSPIVVDAGAAFDSSQFTENGFEELARRFPSPLYKSMGMIAADAFRAEVDRYVGDIRDGHLPLPGTDRVYLPGHLEEERMVEYRRDGIPFGDSEQSAMRGLSERLDLAVPWDPMRSS